MPAAAPAADKKAEAPQKVLSTTINKAEDAAGAIDGIVNVQTQDSLRKASTAAAAAAISDINKSVKENV